MALTVFEIFVIGFGALCALLIIIAATRRCLCKTCITRKEAAKVAALQNNKEREEKEAIADVAKVANPLMFDPPGTEKKLLKTDPVLKSLLDADHALDVLRSCIYEGKKKFKEKKLKEALEHFKRGVGCGLYPPLKKLLKQDREKFELLGQLHASRGLCYLLLDVSSFATHDARFLIRHFPEKWQGWYLSAEAFVKKEEFYKARAAVEKALQCDYDVLLDRKAVERLAANIKEMGRTWEAVENLKEANINWYLSLGGDEEAEEFDLIFNNGIESVAVPAGGAKSAV